MAVGSARLEQQDADRGVFAEPAGQDAAAAATAGNHIVVCCVVRHSDSYAFRDPTVA